MTTVRFRRSLAALCAIPLFGALLATAPSTARADKASEQAYLAMVEKVKNEDDDIDFTKMRMLYTKTKWYQPFGPGQGKARAAVQLAMRNQPLKATEVAEDVLKTDILNPYANYAAGRAYAVMRMRAVATFHLAVFRAVILSVRKSGDGKSPKTAFIVISPAELDMTVRSLQKTVSESEREVIGKKTYRKVTVKDDEGKESVLYFDVSLSMPHLPKDKPKK